MFGLPDGVTACLFDMDGVVTQTAVVAAAGLDPLDPFTVLAALTTFTNEYRCTGLGPCSARART